MITLEAERPHVTTMNEGLRGIDRFRVNPDVFVAQLLTLSFIDFGTSSLVFGTPKNAPTNIIRLPVFTILGRERTLKVFTSIPESRNQNGLLKLRQRIEKISPHDYEMQIRKAEYDTLLRIVSANANFRRNPGLTIPINTLFTVHDSGGLYTHPIATFEKKIEGRQPRFESEYLHLEDTILSMGGDLAEKNIFFDVSPYEDDQGELHYLHPIHIIDFSTFIPSNVDLP